PTSVQTAATHTHHKAAQRGRTHTRIMKERWVRGRPGFDSLGLDVQRAVPRPPIAHCIAIVARRVAPPAVDSTRFSGGSSYPSLASVTLMVTLIWSLRDEATVKVRVTARLKAGMPLTVAAMAGSAVAVRTIPDKAVIQTEGRTVKKV